MGLGRHAVYKMAAGDSREGNNHKGVATWAELEAQCVEAVLGF